MPNINSILAGLTDEEILDEFVKRFDCDAAILIYLESNTEYGFTRWANSNGRQWAKRVFTLAQNHSSIVGYEQELYKESEASTVIA